MRGLQIVFMLLLFVPGAARAAQPCEPLADYWYVERLEPAALDLPEGISVSAAAQGARGILSLSNTTPEPLFVMPRQYRDLLVMETPDPNWDARLRMVHEVAAYLAVAGTRQTISLQMEALIDLDPGLRDLNVKDAQPPDPAAALPAAQASELLLVYKGQVLVVPFSLTYQTNEFYDNGNCPGAQPAQEGPPAGSPAGPLVVGLVSLAVTGLFFWLFLSLLRGRR